MPTTDTTVSRLQLVHPDLAHDGGSTLHTKVRTAWTKIGDNMNDRFFTYDALADAASQDFAHNFKCAFRELKVVLYLRNTGTGELTRLTPATTPSLLDFTIVATPGSETTSVRVTNSSGAARDIALVVEQDGGQGRGSFTLANGQAAAADVTPLKFDGSKTKAAIIPYEATRRTDSENRQTVGHIRVVYDADDAAWRIEYDSKFDNVLGAGHAFTVTAAGQVQYTTDSIAGASYSGTLRFADIVEIPVTP